MVATLAFALGLAAAVTGSKLLLIGAGLAGLVILVSAIGIASLLAAIMGEPAVSAGPGRRRLGHGR